MFMTIAMVLVIALPATAKKPNKPKPPTAAPIALHIDAEPMWVHEEGDNLRYSVTVDNKTATDITDVTVYFEADSGIDSVDHLTIPANDSVTINTFSFLVSESSEAMACIAIGQECGVPASVQVKVGDVLVTEQTMSTRLMPYPPCDFGNGDVSDTVPVSDVCIWTPPQTGVWKITLPPAVPDNQNGPINAVVAVRDGVPGNWCTLLDSDNDLVEDPESTFTRKWRAGDADVFGWVYLPGDENGVARDGMCLHGGAGGDYFQVGNPDSFYLRANGTVTTEWVPPPPPPENQ